MHTRATSVAVVLSAALALGACGSSSSSISKADYVTKGNKICADGKKAIDKVPTPNADPTGDLTAAQLKEIADYLDKGVKIQNDQVQKLRDLGSPKGDDSKLKKIYDTSDKGTKELAAAATAARANNAAEFRTQLEKGGNELDQAQKDIKAYGLDQCGGSSSSSSSSSSSGSTDTSTP